MSGTFGKKIDNLVSKAGFSRQKAEHSTHQRQKNWYGKDLKTFGDVFVKDDLFDYKPGRAHAAFINFTRSPSSKVRDPIKFGKHLRSLSEDRDFWESVRRETREREMEENRDDSQTGT